MSALARRYLHGQKMTYASLWLVWGVPMGASPVFSDLLIAGLLGIMYPEVKVDVLVFLVHSLKGVNK